VEYQNSNGLNLSKIGVGCYSLSGVYGKKDINQFKEMINRAYKAGISFFDTAAAYGDAEKILGEIIKPYRDRVILSTKVGVEDGAKPVLSSDYIKKSCEDSLKRLNTDYIDVYNVHFNDPETAVEETVAAFEDLVREGKIRKYGLGHLPMEKVTEYIEKGNIFSILMELSAVSRKSAKVLLPFCRKHKINGIAFSVTGRGLLTGKYDKNTRFEKGDIRNLDPQFQREKLDYSLKIMIKLRELGKGMGKTPVQVAIGWVLAREGISTALIGPSTVEHLEENLGGTGWVFPAEELNQLDDFIAEQEKILKRNECDTIESIMDNELSGDREKDFVDLVYCIETAITNDFVKEEEILPVFYLKRPRKLHPSYCIGWR